MAGIYLHIPFCKQACFYCDFHFSVNQSRKAQIVEGLTQELVQRKSFLNDETVNTIYFGGGTPSLLTEAELNQILASIYNTYSVAKDAEITLEANPDDLTNETLKALKTTGVNRLSVGIQSFSDDILKWMNRSHNANQALECIDLAQHHQFADISIDLIYGIPGLTDEFWRETVHRALALPVNHLSAYSLTLEEKTPYQKLVNQKKYLPPPEEQASRQFLQLAASVDQLGWEHYEVSNFCKSGNYSKHNTAYWKRIPYLGIGPSAHSFSNNARMWNAADNATYLKQAAANQFESESEKLTETDIYNETILTGLRTKWGVEIDVFNTSEIVGIQQYIENNLAILKEGKLTLTREGLLYADQIASNLFRL